MIWLAVVGGYVLTSLLLLKYPTILHKKKEIRFRAMHISHRGGECNSFHHFYPVEVPEFL